MITGSTKLVGIFGDPVNGSLSPAMHNAAFTAAGLDWAYLPFNVRAADLSAAVAGIRALSLVGVNVTMPHKAAVVPLLDYVDTPAAAITSVNTVVNNKGRLEGYSTDGAGFLSALADASVATHDKNIVIVGTGGAARAVAAALAATGISRLDILARRPDAITRLGDTIAQIHSTIEFATHFPTDENVPDIIAGADIVINATPLGKKSLEGLTYLVNGLAPDTTAADLSTVPPLSAFLVAAQERGCTVINGRSMLVHQGSLSYEMWTGQTAPLDVMRRVVGEMR